MSKRKRSKEKKEKFLEKSNKANETEINSGASLNALAEMIKDACEGLYYISETDAEVTLFVGKPAEVINKEDFLIQIGKKADAPVEERNFSEFFARLTAIQDWYGDEETTMAKRFAQLKELLENNLRDLRVYKVGRVELDVYAIGLDAENNLLGIKTLATET